jgi:predicted acylesterase/phospholipase RssA
MAYRILSLSGGGMRGLFQACYLAGLEESLKVKLADWLDLVSGTSTGTIIAAGLAAKIDLHRIVDLFSTHGSTIFNAKWFGSFRGGGRYSNASLHSLLKDVFGNKKLGDCNKPHLAIAATTLDRFEPRTFVSWNSDDQPLSLVDVIMASCAAPTYFPSWKPVGQARSYIDGGMWANTPSLVAAMTAFRERGIKFADMKIVSVGNGEVPQGNVGKDYDSQNLLALVGTLYDIMFSTQSITADKFAEVLVGKTNFLRINTQLEKWIGLDDFALSKAKLPALAEREARQTADDVAAMLECKKPPPSGGGYMGPGMFPCAIPPTTPPWTV